MGASGQEPFGLNGTGGRDWACVLRAGPWLVVEHLAIIDFLRAKEILSESQCRRGEGINRVTFFGQRRWFPFGTRFEASFLDGEPAFVLDYARPGNPPLIKSIVDEVREVAPKLYMGPAALKVSGRARPILFFAVSLQ